MLRLSEDIAADPELDALLRRLRTRRLIFTASVVPHARNCLRCLGVPADRFERIIDTAACGYETKHSVRGCAAAASSAGGSRGGRSGTASRRRCGWPG